MNQPAAQKAIGLPMVPDRPVASAEQDRLGFAAYAGVFATFFLDKKTPTPMTVAITGPWGSGKTSLAQLIAARIRVTENWSRHGWFEEPVTCWFNAWHHADAPNVGGALAAHLARVLAPERPLWLRAFQPLPTSMLTPSRRWWRRVWQGLTSAAVAVAALVLLVWLVPALRGQLGPIGAVPEHATNPVVLLAASSALLALAARAYRAGGTLGGYLESPQQMAANGSMAEVREHLRQLVRHALRQRSRIDGDRRLVIFIDDLERCPADKALGVCEVITQLLDHPGVIVVVVSDLTPLATAAALRYSVDGESSAATVLGQRYLDKLINMRFDLPPLSSSSVSRMFAEQEEGS